MAGSGYQLPTVPVNGIHYPEVDSFRLKGSSVRARFTIMRLDEGVKNVNGHHHGRTVVNNRGLPSAVKSRN